jgi:hypothetical protein
MLAVEQLAYVLAKEYPDLVRWRDYWVAHPVDSDSLEQTGTAWIVEWNAEGVKKPSPARIRVLWEEKYKDECLSSEAAASVRVKRDELLIGADKLVERAKDLGAADAELAARAYRQALRDVPSQEGFPTVVTWPTAPAV